MGEAIKKLTIEGFKSIRKLEDFELRSLNVLIGANGAGKTNFVSFFRLLRELIEQRLELAVAKGGGADALLHLGPKTTKEIVVKLYIGLTGYEVRLVPTNDNRLVFADERTICYGQQGKGNAEFLATGHHEAKLKERKDNSGVTTGHGVSVHVYDALSSWVVYHFHDTSDTADVRRSRPINDNEFLRHDASNLAAFLYRIQKTNATEYAKIRAVVRLAAPFFDDFKLRPLADNPEMIQLEWTQKGSDYPFRPSQLSDGTLRFICLATALLQPSLPTTVLFDEPELGLHPYALTLLANLFKQAATRHGTYISRQVIVSTQSTLLLNEFVPEDVVVVERAQGQSTFRRLDAAQLADWLKEYGLGDLWQKNVLGGRPTGENSPPPPVGTEAAMVPGTDGSKSSPEDPTP